MTNHPNRSRRQEAPGRNPSADEVRALRKRMNFTQEQLAQLLYVSTIAVRTWEDGSRRMPGITWEYANLLERKDVQKARAQWLAEQRDAATD